MKYECDAMYNAGHRASKGKRTNIQYIYKTWICYACTMLYA